MNKSSRTVAIITFHSWINGNLNYGATLQAFALCKAVEQLGHNVELINYIPEAINAGSLPKNIYRRLFRFLISRKVPRAKRNGFNRFIQQYCSLGKVRYQSLTELQQSPPVADIYLVGSDQVWNTRIFHGALFSAYFLGFGPSSKQRISYASSFGTHEPDVCHRDKMATMLKNFSALSVRESSGVNVIEDLLGANVPVQSVLDPTLLLEHYNDVSVSMETQGTLLAYLFDPTHDDITLLRETAERLSLEPALIWDKRLPRFEEVRLIECDSPAQWLGAMRNAESIVTNSFHGTVFSILFQHPFVSLLADTQGMANRNTRVIDLAAKLGLEDCLSVKRDADVWSEILNSSTEWADVEAKLQNEREASLEYLCDAIEVDQVSGNEV